MRAPPIKTKVRPVGAAKMLRPPQTLNQRASLKRRLTNSTGQQIGPGLVADLPDLCGLRSRAQAQLKFNPVGVERPTREIVFVVRNTGFQQMGATATRALCSRLTCIDLDRDRLPSRLLNGLLNPLANFRTAAGVFFLSVGLVAWVYDTDQ